MGIDRIEIAVGDMTFTAITAGPAAGELVLLLHGFPQTAESWRETVLRLASLGYRAVAVNQRGYSPGANPPEIEAYSIDKLAADAVATAHALGHERFHIVGHDWGGGVAWAVAALHPESIASMCSVSTPHPRAFEIAARHDPRQALKSAYMPFFQLPAVPELLLGSGQGIGLALGCWAQGLPRDEAFRELRAISRVGLTGPLNWYRAMRIRSDAVRHLPAVDVPTLYVWGRWDPFLGRTAAEGTADWVTGTYHFAEIPAGHWIPSRNRRSLHRDLEAHLEAAAG